MREILSLRFPCERFGEAKVEDDDLPGLGKHDVRRLEVPVEDPSLVGRLEPFRHLPQQRERFLHRNRSLRYPLSESLTRDQLHHQKLLAVRLFELDDFGEMRRRSRRSDAQSAPTTERAQPARVVARFSTARSCRWSQRAGYST